MSNGSFSRPSLVEIMGSSTQTTPALTNRIDIADYGTTVDGQAVHLYTLRNEHRMTVRFISYGGIITSIEVPDREGRPGDVVLGFSSLNDYETQNGSIYFGAIIGRYGNRIGNARFTLDGHEYRLAANDHQNTLHGGRSGFDKQVWDVVTHQGADAVSATLSHTSPDGDEGFPGTLRVHVTYTLTNAGELRIDYKATTDRNTVLNLTNHTYFNLAGNGSGSVADQMLQIKADRFTPVDATMIPTGELSPVAGTPFDFRRMVPIGAGIAASDPQIARAGGYDHNFVLNKPPGDPMPLAAIAYAPRTGRILEVHTTEPGMQVYTSNFLDGTRVGSAGTVYNRAEAFTMETQHFPDSPNRPAFPSTVLKAGDTYRSTTVFRFKVDADPSSSCCPAPGS